MQARVATQLDPGFTVTDPDHPHQRPIIHQNISNGLYGFGRLQYYPPLEVLRALSQWMIRRAADCPAAEAVEFTTGLAMLGVLSGQMLAAFRESLLRLPEE